jgi:O-antigen ligase
MFSAGTFPRTVVIAAALGSMALAFNLALAFGLSRQSLLPALALACLPAALLLFGALTAEHRHLLIFAGLALNMSLPVLNRPILGPLYPADFIVALALGSWLASALLHVSEGRRPAWPDTRALGWPLAAFAAAIIWATLRGHEAYGTSLIGQPVRLVIYAAMAGAVAGANPRIVYRGVVATFYIGTVWMFLNALYHLANGTSQTQSITLSTGGIRTVSLTVSLYLAVALFLALLNLQVDDSVSRRLLHIGIAALAGFGAVIGYGRAVYIVIAVLLPLVLLGVRRVRGAAASMIPFVLPFAIIVLIVVPRALPELAPTLIDRVTAPQTDDPNVEFRAVADKVGLDIFKESPLIGVGFTREISFMLNDKQYDATLGAHNSLLWILAGGGIFAFGSFALICLISVYDGWRRLRHVVDARERVLILWSRVALIALLMDAVSVPLLSAPSTLVTLWIVLLLPTVVRTSRPVEESGRGRLSPVLAEK